MDIRIATLEDLKKRRPDLYQDVKQEVCLGKLRLTKDDIVSLIEPLLENIKEHLKPYLANLSAMTYNDIVDMENDIIDEVSELLLDEFDEIEGIVKGEIKKKSKKGGDIDSTIAFAKPVYTTSDVSYLDIMTLDDLKSQRPDLCDSLYEEFLEKYMLNTPQKSNKQKEKVEERGDMENVVKKGDAIRWNYTKDEGIVIGFENDEDVSNIVVQRYDGTKVLFENDPSLFTIIDGEEKADVISKRENYKAKTKVIKETGNGFTLQNITRTIYDGILYNEPTRRGSKLKIGDKILFKKTKESGVVKGFMRKGGLDRILIEKGDNVSESIIDYPEAYEIIGASSKQKLSPAVSKYFPIRKMKVRKAKIGDVVQRKSDGLIGKVIEIKVLDYGIEKLILELKNGIRSEVFNEPSMYYVLID